MCQSGKSKGHSRQSISIFIQQYLIIPKHVPSTIIGMDGIAGTWGNTLLKSLPSFSEVFFLSDPCHPASLQHPCKCRYLLHMKIYGEIALPWFKRTRSWLFLRWGGREGLCFSVFWSKAHSCHMRTPWKCNLSSPRHRLGLTICLRPQSDWGLSLAEHLLHGSNINTSICQGE